MARPVVPIRVRGSVVRVDVARPIIPAVIEVAATADSPDHVGIDQVGEKTTFRMCAAIPDAEDYSTAHFLPLVFGRKLRIP